METGAWRARAAACELLAFTFRYPAAELVEAVRSGEWSEASLEVLPAAGVPLGRDAVGAVSAVAEASRDEDDDPLSSLRAEATRLFVGTPTAAVSPYEGVWRAKDDGVEPLLFVNPHSVDVERFARACGLGRPEGTNEPLDHVSTEFELLQYLALAESGVVVPGGMKPEEFPGGSAAAAYGTFMREHALLWMPRFADSVVATARTSFYQAAGILLGAFLSAQEGCSKGPAGPATD